MGVGVEFSNTSVDSSAVVTNVTSAPRTDWTNVYVTIEALLFLVICSGNALVIIAVCQFRRLRSVTNYFLLSLAVADMLVGLVMPAHIIFYLSPHLLENCYLCLSRYASLMTSCNASLFSMFLVALHRYIAVLHPLHYHVLIQPAVTRSLIAASWTFAVIFGMLPFSGWNTWDGRNICRFEFVLPASYVYVFVIMPFFVLSVVIITLYARLFWEAKLQLARVQPDIGIHTTMRHEIRRTKVVVIYFKVFIFGNSEDHCHVSNYYN